MKSLYISGFKSLPKEKKTFRIVILEDSEVFNEALTRQLKSYAAVLSIENGCKFEIESYASPNDCLRNLKNDTDIAFVDYYLGDGVIGSDIAEKIKEQCWDCRIIMMSQTKNAETTSISAGEGALNFIYKDTNALHKICFMMEDIVNSSLSRFELN